MSQSRWEVWLGKKLTNEVYFDSSMSAQEVKDSLVRHDGFHPGIRVVCKEPRIYNTVIKMKR